MGKNAPPVANQPAPGGGSPAAGGILPAEPTRDRPLPGTPPAGRIPAAAGRRRIDRPRPRQIEALGALRADLLAEWEMCLAELRNDQRSRTEGDQASNRESGMSTVHTLEHLGHRLREVDQALARLGDGTYGICVACGREISSARLQANPLACRCIGCQENTEKGRWRRAV